MFFSHLIPIPLEKIFEKGTAVFTGNIGQNCFSFIGKKGVVLGILGFKRKMFLMLQRLKSNHLPRLELAVV